MQFHLRTGAFAAFLNKIHYWCVVVDNMLLVQYGVTNDSRVILSVKDTDSMCNAMSSTSAAVAAGCSQTPELSNELMTLLLRHFTPADAERVAEEFRQV